MISPRILGVLNFGQSPKGNMMETSLILGCLAQVCTAFAGAWYLYGVIRGTNKPKLASWLVWSLIGGIFCILNWLSPVSTQLEKIFAFILFLSPASIFVVGLKKKNEVGKFSRSDKVALVFGFISLCYWIYLKDNPGMMPIILAIMADICGLIPTLIFVWKNPHEDRPIPWLVFCLGSAITYMAVPDKIENYLLSLYMTVGSFSVSIPLMWYRWKNRLPLKEWI